jgi:hypothetical protein
MSSPITRPLGRSLGRPLAHMLPRRAPRRTLIAAVLLQALALPALADSYDWSSGTFVGGVTAPNPLGAGDTLNVLGGGYKYVNSAIVSAGTILASDNLYFQNGNVISSSGVFDFLGDVGFQDAGYNGGFVNTGIFRKSGGTGNSVIAIAGFSSSGVIDTQVGTLLFNAGAQFGNGSSFTGGGSTVVSAGASFTGVLTSANLVLSGGIFTGSGAQVNGAVAWTGGTLGGDWTVNAGQSVAIQGGGYKYLNGSLANQGTLAAADNLYFQNGNTLSNVGLYDMQGDVGLYDGGYNGYFTNTGTLRKSAGSGTSYVAITGFSNSGTIDVQSGSIEFNTGAVFNAGSVFKGPGTVVVSSGATFNGGFGTQGNLRLTAGTFYGSSAQIGGDTTFSGGTFTGDWTLLPGRTLTLAGGSYKYLNGSLLNQGTVAAADNLYFQNGNTLTNITLVDLQGDVGLYDGSYNGYFVNSGTLRKSAGTGTSYVSIAGFSNSGTIEVQSGSIEFNAGAVFNAGSVFKGPGTVVVSGGAAFNGGFSTDGNLRLTAGTFTGNGALIAGNTTFSGGTFTGDWTLLAGRTLTLAGGSYKYLNGSLLNQGTVAAADNLYFLNGNTLTNTALVDLQGDLGLYDGGYNGYFVNSGTLRKSAGTGTSYVSIAGFSNSGTIEVASGSIEFNAGAVFNGGSRFKGPGSVVVSNGASFNGDFTTQGNLVLSGGDFTGSTARALGNVTWTGGRLNGTWENGAGQTLTLAAGSYKYLNGSLVNSGKVVATDTLNLQNGNTYTNAGRHELQGDVGIGDGGYSGTVVNSGLIVKTAGTGVSALNAVSLVNTGVIDVQTGTIALPSNFANAGTLKGNGTFSTNLVTNNGHVAPGESPGTLTISGSFAQSAAGFLDIELGGTAGADLLHVTGSAALDGTLAIACWGDCSYAVGTQLVILDALGGVSGSFAGSPVLSGFASGAFAVSYRANEVLLTVTEATVAAVPEPGVWLLLLGGLGALKLVQRRRA